MKTSKKLKSPQENTIELIRSVGLKVTKPRIAILQLLSAKHGPFTIEDVQGQLSGLVPAKPVDLVTIYRCLTIFEKLKLVNQCDFGDGLSRYEKADNHHHHHHIICRFCKKVESIASCPLDKHEINLPQTSFKDVTHRLEFFGVCPACQKQGPSVKNSQI